MMSEADLVLCELLTLKFQGGDRQAAGELVKLFEKPLIYFLRRMVGSEADAWDLMQQTWMTVFQTLTTLRDGRALPAFLYRTARNRALGHLRKKNTDLRMYDEKDLEEMDAGPEETFAAEDAAAVHAGLLRLSLPHREILTLFFMEDLSIADIAQVVGIPPGTVKSRLYHAKKALALILRQGDNHVQ